MDSEVAKKISSGKLSIGTWLTFPSTDVAEVLSQAGYEWIVVDLEHSAISIANCPDLFRSIELHGSIPIARLTNNDPNLIKRVLDAGAKGIIVPNIETKEDVLAAIKATKYPPKGNRGVGLSRAQGYGNRFNEYVEWQKSEIMVIVLIENIKAVNNIKSILSISEITAYIIGPYDLSASMGIPGKFKDKEFLEKISEIKKVAKEFNCPAGYHLVEPDLNELKRLIKEKYSMIAFSVDFRMLDTVAQGPFKG